MAYHIWDAYVCDRVADHFLVGLRACDEGQEQLISSRYALTVGVLLGVALVPTIIHSYLGARSDDGRRAKAIDTMLAGLRSIDTARRPEWVKNTYGSDNWIERKYLGAGGSELLLFVASSYDLKRLYHHPELGVLYGTDLSRAQTVDMPETNGMPVHVMRSNTGSGIVAYALLYDGQLVANPISLQLMTAMEQVISARTPMTLLLAHDPNAPSGSPVDNLLVMRLLTEAIESFLSQPHSKSR